MIWQFQKGHARTCVEVRREPATGRYVVLVTAPDGSERQLAFADPARLVAEASSVQRRLIEGGWAPVEPAAVARARTRRHARRRTVVARGRLAVARVRTAVLRVAATFGF